MVANFPPLVFAASLLAWFCYGSSSAYVEEHWYYCYLIVVGMYAFGSMVEM